MAAQTKVRFCDRSFSGIADSNPACRTHICLSRVLCTVGERSLWRADHSSKEVILTVCLCHWMWSGTTTNFYTYNDYVELAWIKKCYNTNNNAVNQWMSFVDQKRPVWWDSHNFAFNKNNSLYYISLNFMLKEERSGLTWLLIRTGGGLLCSRYWTFSPVKRKEFFY